MSYVGILGEDAPTKLEDILAYNNGRVGVIVDAKEAHIFYSKYRENLCNLLNEYAKKGEIMLQSFNPILMLNLKNRLSGVLTGQLICRGNTLTETFSTKKPIGYTYERLLSLICFVSSTDVINMENHSDRKWRRRVGKRFNNSNLCVFAKRRNILSILVDKIQRRVVKKINKPVFVYTINEEEDLNQMKEILISNYIADYSHKGVEEYLRLISRKI